MKPYDDLVLASATLSGSPGWETFVKAFRTYRDEHLNLMTQAAPDRVLVFQGRAQNMSELETLFTNCRDKAKVIRERKDAG